MSRSAKLCKWPQPIFLRTGLRSRLRESACWSDMIPSMEGQQRWISSSWMQSKAHWMHAGAEVMLRWLTSQLWFYVNSDAHPPLSVLATHAVFQNMRPQGNDSDALMFVRACLHVRTQQNVPEHTHNKEIHWCPNVFVFFADLRTSGCSSCFKTHAFQTHIISCVCASYHMHWMCMRVLLCIFTFMSVLFTKQLVWMGSMNSRAEESTNTCIDALMHQWEPMHRWTH